MRFPFTREEYTRALLQVMPPEEVSAIMNSAFAAETIGINIADGDLLIIAALSDEMGERVLTYRPALREMVQRVRANPIVFLADVRRSYGTEAHFR